MHNFLRSSFLCLLIWSLPSHAENTNCDDPATSIARHLAEAGPGPGISRKFQEEAKTFSECGRESVQAALMALDQSNENTYYPATYLILSLKEFLQPRDFSTLSENFRDDGDWLPTAVAATGHEDAFEFLLAKALETNSRGGDQFEFAFEKADSEVAAELLKLVDCRQPPSQDASNTFFYLFLAMGNKAAWTADSLEQTALDASCPTAVREMALSGLISLVESGVALSIDRLLPLTNHPDEMIRRRMEYIVTKAGGSAAAATYARRISELAEQHDAAFYLREVAETGPAAHSAGPAIVSNYNQFDFSSAPWAALAIGRIGYKEGVPQLIRILANKSDWQASKAAADALGMLRAEDAQNQLRVIAEQHWFPPVRRSAKQALDAIKNDPKGELYSEPDDPFFFEESNWVDTCATTDLYPYSTPSDDRFYASERPDQAAKFAFRIDLPDDYPLEPGQPRFFMREPNVGINVNGGWLLGSNQGEFGGEIAYTSPEGKTQIIDNRNVEDIYEFSNGTVVAVTGLAHLSFNRGVIVRLDRARDGKWPSTPWLKLPAAPQSSWLIAPNELLVNTLRGGSVIISEDGAIRMADCHDES